MASDALRNSFEFVLGQIAGKLQSGSLTYHALASFPQLRFRDYSVCESVQHACEWLLTLFPSKVDRRELVALVVEASGSNGRLAGAASYYYDRVSSTVPVFD